jgi:circadian clock protein KaiB
MPSLLNVPDHANETSSFTCNFRLYVAGEAPNSNLALRNLKALCRDCYGEDYRIDVVDILLSPERAWKEGVIVTPMAVRFSPLPALQIIGNLSDTKLILDILGFSGNNHD